MKNDSAISSAYIESELKDFDRITLYRTLKTFKEKGVIHEITYPNEDKLFALCESDCSEEEHSHQHVHFLCKTCDKVSCIEIDTFPNLKLTGYQIDQIEIQMSGICVDCKGGAAE